MMGTPAAMSSLNGAGALSHAKSLPVLVAPVRAAPAASAPRTGVPTAADDETPAIDGHDNLSAVLRSVLAADTAEGEGAAVGAAVGAGQGGDNVRYAVRYAHVACVITHPLDASHNAPPTPRVTRASRNAPPICLA